ncbi:MAG: VOC family protein [Myxococcota bacterium]
MYAVPDLEAGVAWATEVFDRPPAFGGSHTGLGTRNALLSLGNTYLELIAPDPAQPLAGTFGERVAALSAPGLVTWAVRSDLARAKRGLAAHGIETIGPQRTERVRADGGSLVWDLLFPTGHGFGLRMPFVIDWLDCALPSSTQPVGGRFASLALADPNADALAAALAALGLRVEVAYGDPKLFVQIETAAGSIDLDSTTETAELSMI